MPAKKAVRRHEPEKQTVVLSCVNLKGGVGKTALAVNFAAYCGMQGLKTLLIDLDPQTNATFSCLSVDAWELHAKEHGTVANLLGVRQHSAAEGSEKSAADVMKKRVFRNVDLIPSHLDLFSVDLDLATATSRERKLRRALSPIISNYRVVVCDCPPNLTIPTQNALAISTHFVTPVSLDYLSALGVGLLLNRIQTLGKELECDLQNAGIVIGRVGRPSLHRSQTQAAIRLQFKELVLNNEIRERSAVAESAEKQTPIFRMRDHDAAAEFSAVCRELFERLDIEE